MSAAEPSAALTPASRLLRPADAVVARRHASPVRWATLCADAADLVRRLGPGGPVLNLGRDRYTFTVGLLAAAACERVTLMPAQRSAAAFAALRSEPAAGGGEPCALVDGDEPSLAPGWPRVPILQPSGPSPRVAPPADALLEWTLPGDAQAIALVFTSGSTGRPVPHLKRWSALRDAVLAGLARFGACDAATPAPTLVGTVPAQHMYGLESTVLLPLLGGGALVAERPLFPADVAAALAAVPAPRWLVTTPFHLRTLLDADLPLPPVDRVLSATAPLSAALAERAEARLGARLVEIYGCTETGQIASREPVRERWFGTLDGVTLHAGPHGWCAAGGHVAGRVALADAIELRDAGHFAVLGRMGDLVNVAGKRSTLGFLDQQLLAVPGVIDGAFFVAEAGGAAEADGGVCRLGALVVAPTLDAASLRRALSERIDPAFLPRPLRFVEALPRNATGKLTQAALRALLAGGASRTRP